jgi:hypothetical protein
MPTVPEHIARGLARLQTRPDSNYIGIADVIYRNRITTQLEAQRAYGIHYTDGVQKTLDYILGHEEHIGKGGKAPAQKQLAFQQHGTGYFVPQKHGDVGLPRTMKRVALTHSVYEVQIENGKIVSVKRVK